MTTPSTLRNLLGCTLLCFYTLANSQNTSGYSGILSNTSPVDFSPFNILHQRDENVLAVAPEAQLLTLNDAVLGTINQLQPDQMSIGLPYHGEQVVLDLERVTITTSDFTVISEKGAAALPYQPGNHYRGTIRGIGGIAALSFFENEIMGLVVTPESGNLVLGRLTYRDNKHHYVLYNDTEMAVPNPFSCHTTEEGDSEISEIKDLAEVDKCVRVFMEADNELFIDKGSSVQNTVNYLLGMFNQSAALYANEQINTIVSQIFVWTTADFYSTTSSATALNQFRTFRTQFNGDLAHLVGIGGNNLGGIAYVDVLCSTYNIAFSDISTSYNNVPTYSWTVEVFTHEMGHNLGSNHTQWCGWQGGPIDNCVTQEGACNPGPSPVNGGTIMSYCHLTNYGINFNNGFGPLPGNKIRTEVAGATCLPVSCGATNPCAAPIAISVTNITGSGATIGWATVNGATGYTLRYRVVGNASWTTISSPANPYTITGLPNNDEIEVTVQSLCGSNASDYKNGVIFKTGATGGGGGSTCGTPGGLNVAPTTTTAVMSWQVVAGAASYAVSWKLATASTWSNPVSVTSANYTITGLTASQTYDARVSAVCSGGVSSFASTTFTTQSSGGGSVCTSPSNLAVSPSSSTALAAWTGGSGAISYQIQWKPVSNNSWGTIYSTTNSTYNLTGLSSGTAYNVRVRKLCSDGVSAFITTTFTTQSSGGGGGTCAVPGGLTASYVYATSARLSWLPSQGAVNYTMRIKTIAGSSWFTFNNLPTTIVTVQNLAASTSYMVEVRSNCTGGVSSAYCTTYYFTTPSQLVDGNSEDRDGDLVIHLGSASKIEVFPNPTSGWFSVITEEIETETIDLKVVNWHGQVVVSMVGGTPGEQIQINLEDQPAGVYHVVIQDKNKVLPAKRIIKL